MKAAVIGCNGYLGQHIVNYLGTKKDVSTTGFDLHERYAGSDKIAYHRMDITKAADVQLLKEEFDILYYFTGLTGTDTSIDRYEQFVSVNELGLLHLLNHLRSFSRQPKIVFPSTRLVYKGVEGVPLAEEAEKEFKTIYASSKYSGEQYLQMHRNLFGIEYTVFRVCVPYGNLMASALSYGTVGFFLGKAQKGEDIMLFGDGALQRTFTHVWDVCRQIVEVGGMAESTGRVFNIDGETFSLKEIAALIAGKHGVQCNFTPWPAKALKLESGDTIFDSSRIRALLPQTLTYSVEKWIHA